MSSILLKLFLCTSFRAGSNRNPSGGSSNGSNNQGVLPPQFVQVEMTSPDDQQFIVYTEWNNKQKLLSKDKYMA